MKVAAAILLLVSAAALGIWRVRFEADQEPRAASALKRAAAEAPSSINTEFADVFRKAFWQRPGAGDQVLHAERREWVDAVGLQKWQWFIVVDASPELLKRLRDDNVFNLHSDVSKPTFQSPPDWFQIPSADVEFMVSSPRHLFLIFSKTGRRIYATDSGSGFRPGVAEPVPNSIPSQSARPAVSGRLPNSMPPQPIPKSP